MEISTAVRGCSTDASMETSNGTAANLHGGSVEASMELLCCGSCCFSFTSTRVLRVRLPIIPAAKLAISLC